MADSVKPLLLFCSGPIGGHLGPCKIIAKQLISLGYEVTFVTGSKFGPGLEEIGATFIPLQGYSNFDDSPAAFLEKWPLRENLKGPEKLLYDMENIFINAIPSQYETVQTALKIMMEKNPGRQIVVLHDLTFCGVYPLMKNAQGLKPLAFIAIGISSVFLSSQDVAPYGPGLPPDSSPEGRERNKAMQANIQSTLFAKVDRLFNEKFDQLGADRPGHFLLDCFYLLSDRFVQLCAPSVEYPRSDTPKPIYFSGGVPKGHRDVVTSRPEWWEEVTGSKGKKRIIFVCQGTVAVNYEELIIPTIQAFADRDNVLVVAALGIKGASLPVEVKIPGNVFVQDFIPFDDILPYCDVFISNGGYGAFQHGLGNGIPMVMGGETEDKPENCMRLEWTGAGINLRTASPGAEKLRDEVEKVFKNTKYKERAEQIMKEMEGMDPIKVFVEQIEGVVREKNALAN